MQRLWFCLLSFTKDREASEPGESKLVGGEIGVGTNGVVPCRSIELGYSYHRSKGFRKRSKFKLLVRLLEKAMAPHSSTLAWKIPWMAEPGRLQSMGSLRVGHDWVTSLSLFPFTHCRRKLRPTPVFLPGEPRDGGAWWAAVYGVAQSRTRLKRLSSSSSSSFVKRACKWEEISRR